MATRERSLTKQRNSRLGRGLKKARRTRTGVKEGGGWWGCWDEGCDDVAGVVSSKAWSRSWLMKEEDLRRM
jgi:hypothetical protein